MCSADVQRTMTEDERRQILVQWNSTKQEYPQDLCVHELFEQQVARTPHAVAVVCGDQHLTYQELNERANQLAHHLRKSGVGPDVLVGICVERSLEMVVGLLGVLKAGGAYVPLDPAYPAERLRYMLDDSAPALLLTQGPLKGLFAASVKAVVVIDLVADAPTWVGQPLGNPDSASVGLTSRHLAYVIYTSGSTGRPKGVAMPHCALVNLLWWQKESGSAAPRRTLQFAALGFDVAFQETFSTLAFGGELILIDEGKRFIAVELMRVIAEKGIERLFLPFAALQMLAEEMAQARRRDDVSVRLALREIITAGEQLRIDHNITAMFRQLERCTLENQYGPTETHVVTAFRLPADVSDWPALPAIGRPIANSRIYILDGQGEPVPIGVEGEIYIGGAGVARGYLNQHRLTTERFVPDRFTGQSGSRMYKTGDMGRWRQDGMIEFLGRNDFQVKIRGFRIELGEIEAVLGRHPQIRQTVVTVRELEAGDKRLVAYIVWADPALPAGVDELRGYLLGMLPEYMVPSQFVCLAALPLTPNGKIDRGALPIPEESRPQMRENYVEPRNETERALAEIWHEVLKVDRVGVRDNFFDLGGHSLLATRMVAGVRTRLHVELPLRTVFSSPTIYDLAKSINALCPANSVTHSALGTTSPDGSAPLSSAQRALWFLDQYEPGVPAYNIALAIDLEGELHASLLKQSLQGIVDRHEAWRTIFPAVAGEPVQLILPRLSLDLPTVNLSDLPEQQQIAQVDQLSQEEASRPFDLADGPLVRARLLCLGPTRHRLVLSMHHIVSDGWSEAILFDELTRFYNGFVSGVPARLPSLSFQYADYAIWQRKWIQSRQSEEQLTYWKRHLSGAPALLELRTDRPRPAVRRSTGATVAWTLPPSLGDKLRLLSRQHDVTLFMMLLAAFNVLLHRYSGQSDIVVGCPVAGRTRAETEGLIGMFVNTLPLRCDLSGDPTVVEFLHRVRDVALEGFAHQDLPFERLVEELHPARSASYQPIFQVLMVSQNTPHPRIAMNGLKSVIHGLRSLTAQFDISLQVETAEHELSGMLEYCTDLFDLETVERMLADWRRILSEMARDPRQRIGQMPMPAETKTGQLLAQWDSARQEYPRDKCLHQLFEAQAARTPDAVAVVCEHQQLTYQQLNHQANQLAHHLQELGVGPDVLVGICLERSLEMVVGLLGILKAGGAYVPLDPEYPVERLRYMLDDSRPVALLTQSRSRGRFEEYSKTAPVIDLGADAIAWMNQPITDLGCASMGLTPRHLAYVIYTSGSTGKPKGVMIEHRSVCNFLHWMRSAFGWTPADRVLQTTALSFDPSVWECFAPLLAGAQLVLARPGGHRDCDYLVQVLSRERITVFQAVPSLLSAMVEHRGLSSCTSLRYVFSTGEALSPALHDRVRRCLTAQFHNLYGPTECTIDATCWRSDSRTANGPVAIGHPIANTQAYILNEHREPVPAGIAGELYIGGEGLARGYLNRPELTAEKFVPDPFSGEEGARLYRTGDLARYLPDGNIEFLGRMDHQVKIRGYRIELGEIEAVLAQHPQIRQTVVMAREVEAGDKRLVAYLVWADAASVATVEELRAFLLARLPEYMVPSQFVSLEALPLSPNGKLDRKALPAPDTHRPELQETYAAPRNATEELLAGIVCELLKLDRVGIHDSFFDLGGHSLLAMRLASRMREVLQVELPLRSVFEMPTVAGLASTIQGIGAASVPLLPPIQPAPRHVALPLSFAQQRLWFLDQYETNRAIYNIPQAIRLTGRLDVPKLQASLHRIVERHEVLRTTFESVEGEPRQRIAPVAELQVPLVDLSDRAEEQRQAAADELAAADAVLPFDLSRGPLLRASLVQLSAEEHMLLLNMHHIVADGWSMGVVLDELKEIYRSLCRQEEATLPTLAVQYADYALWQRQWLTEEVLEAPLTYWRKQLAGAPAVLELPTDRPRPARQSYRGAWEPFILPKSLSESLAALSQREGVTLFMALLAGLNVLLHRYSHQDDIVVGSAIAGRNRSEIEKLIGFFVNTLVLRTDLSGTPTVRELLGLVREVALGAYSHQDVPFERLVEELNPQRSLSYSPLFQVMLVLQNAPASQIQVPELEMAGESIHSGTSKFDLTLSVEPTSEGLRGTLEYSTDLFEAKTIRRMLGHLQMLLEGMVADPEQRIGQLAMLGEAERQQILVAWNDTKRDYPRDKCVHQLFEDQAARTPHAIAVVCGDRHLTYQQLCEQANQLAHHLRALGMGPDVPVGVCMERSLEMVVSMLGILKAGGAYVPLDPAYPAQRLAFMVSDITVGYLITAGQTEHALAKTKGLTWIDLHRDQRLIGAHPVGNPEHRAKATGLAYVMFTSGSTGQPKGVAIPHRGIVRLVCAQEYARFGSQLRTVFLSSPSFDASTFEVWGPLLHGGACVVWPERSLDFAAMETVIRRHDVTCLFLTSALFNEVVDDRLSMLSSVAHVLTGGETMSVPHICKAMKLLPSTRITNCYGPTESTTFATVYAIRQDDGFANGSVPIGRPIANTQVYILDEQKQPVAVGVAGELYIGGDGLAQGYLNRPELTAAKFVADPFSTEAGAMLYRTGDRARFLPDGNIEFLGRMDHQVKIRGFRIELGEIEAVLGQHAGIRQRVVVAREDVPGDKRLVAYIVWADGASACGADGLREYLLGKLPQYMVPSQFVSLAALPLTPNGKIDRKALPAPDMQRPELQETYAAPRNPTEELLARIFCELLKLDRVGIYDNFFDLGGHSLLATQVVSRVRSALKVELAIRSLFESPTVTGVAQTVGALQAEPPPNAATIVRVSREKPLPLSFGQQRLWFLDQLEPGRSDYNITYAGRLIGALSQAAIERAVAAVVCRHEALRTTFQLTDGEPVQVISKEPVARMIQVDLTSMSMAEQERKVQELASAESLHRFDLKAGPLVRFELLRLSAQEHVLLITIHHAVADGWSMELLAGELASLYAADITGRPAPLPELPIQYADFAVWQRVWLQGDVLEQQTAYWKQQLDGRLAPLELPAERRQSTESHDGASRERQIPLPVFESLRALGRREHVTMPMVILAAFLLLLHRHSGQDEVTVGMPVAGRTHAETEGLIGLFVNMLALRTSLAGNPSFRDLLARVREVMLSAYAHQDFPFEKLVEMLQPERALGRNPIFDIVFNYLSMPTAGRNLPNVVVTDLPLKIAESKMPLTLYVEENTVGLRLQMSYQTAIFSEQRIDLLLEQLHMLLEHAGEAPERPIWSYSMVTADSRHLLPDCQRPLAGDVDGTVLARFASRVQDSPDREAMIDSRGTWTYRELDEFSNRLANRLIASGLQPTEIVAIHAHRSAPLVVALLGAMKAGAAFAVLDATYPAARLRQYAGIVRPRAWIYVEAAGPVPLELESIAAEAVCRIALPPTPSATRQLLADAPATAHGRAPLADDPAYVSFTSGTTGVPKAILGTHRPLAHFVDWHVRTFQLAAEDRFSFLSGLGHDPALRDIFTPLCLGGTLCIPDAAPVRHGDGLCRWMGQQRINVAHLTPAMADILAQGWTPTDGQAVSLDRLRYAFFGGDVLTERQVSALRRLAPKVTCVSFYGTTETPQAVGYFVVPEARDVTPQEDNTRRVIPLGRGIDDVQLLVLNRSGQLAGIGEVGEIHVRTPYLSRGYVGDAELTAERFPADPRGSGPASRLYRTGDLARYLSDGNVEFLGRLDHQVKIRGFRIEPAEIEAVLAQHPQVRQTVVVARELEAGDKRLVAYIVWADAVLAAGVDELREFLLAVLPQYMVPSLFVSLPALPLTPNGKVDRKALPAPDTHRPELQKTYVAPRNPTEELLAGIFCELLKLDRVGIHESFFDLGGHSLLAVSTSARIESRLGVVVPLAVFFQASTIAALAEYISTHTTAERQSSKAIICLRPGNGRPPLFCVPGAGGDAMGLRNLAGHMPPDQPVYATQFRGLDGGEPPHNRIEDMASNFLDAITEISPDGPYNLAGFSAGGLVAYEIAQQLSRSGRQVALLALLDTYGPGYPPLLPLHVRLGRHLQELASRSPRLAAKYALDRLYAIGRRLKPHKVASRDAVAEMPGSIAQAIHRTNQAMHEAIEAYRPQQYAGRITLFHAQIPENWIGSSFEDPSMGWNAYAAGGVDVYEIPASHLGMVSKEDSHYLAAALRACLARKSTDTGTIDHRGVQ